MPVGHAKREELTLDPHLQLLCHRVGLGGSTSSGRGTWWQELWNDRRSRERQGMEEGEDGVWQEGD